MKTKILYIAFFLLFLTYSNVCSQIIKDIYKKEVKIGLSRISSQNPDIITQKDLEPLPPIVQKYLIYCGVVGKEKVLNARMKFSGRIRTSPEDKWMPFSSEQYTFFDKPTRIFYIKASKIGLPITGIHLYKDGTAIMRMIFAGMFTILDTKGPELNQSETVTVFVDMCCLAPATLISKNIQWETIEPLKVKAKFINGKNKISAIMVFNEKGELIKVTSNDRYETNDGKIYKPCPWSAPVSTYRTMNGFRLPTTAEEIFNRSDSDFCYAEFTLKEIEYNCKEYKE